MRSIDEEAITRLFAADDVPQVQSSDSACEELVVTVTGLVTVLRAIIGAVVAAVEFCQVILSQAMQVVADKNVISPSIRMGALANDTANDGAFAVGADCTDVIKVPVVPPQRKSSVYVGALTSVLILPNALIAYLVPATGVPVGTLRCK